MDKYEATRQLCAMQFRVAEELGLQTVCTCDDDIVMFGEVPDALMVEIRRRLFGEEEDRG